MGEPTFALLGPFEVRVDGAPVAVGGPKPRAILATLLLEPGAFVSLDLLTEVLWPGGAPRSAVANVRTYVRGLRQSLAGAGVPTDGLRTRPSGYTFDVPEDSVDLLLFTRLLEKARTARESGARSEALGHYEAALGLWRGGMLQDVPSTVVWDAAVSRAEEARSAAADECLELRLGLGDYAPLVAELRARLGEDPLREDRWQMLIRALHGAGRTGEARAAYAEAERTLAAELGVEPGPFLRSTGEEVNGYPARRRPYRPAAVCQLPIDVPDFSGRSDELALLCRLLAGADRQPAVVAVSGPPGTGKSALAVHAAHEVRDLFPDGQLWADLGGIDESPRDPACILAELLRGLGVIDGAIPAELGERAALFRSRLAQRRFLIVLDDAAGTSQVRPLLPGTGGSAVIVTSRRRMPGLPAHLVPLGVMRQDEARELLASIIGPERLAAERADADRVLAGCGLMPLAVRIAGSRLANRPGGTIRTFADDLHDERGRLDQLRTGDLEVRAGAELSYRHLPPGAAAAFRAFGVLPDEPVPGWLVETVAGAKAADTATGTATDTAFSAAPAAATAGSLETLADEHLVELTGTDPLGLHRYRMHGLLRCYAQELTGAAGSGPRPAHSPEAPGTADPSTGSDGSHIAVLAVLDGLIALARVANSAVPSRFLGVLGEPREPTGPAAAVARAVRERPVEWFETERRLLVTSVETAVRLGHVSRAADLAIELAGFFDMRGYYGEWFRTHRLVLDARTFDARTAPDDAQSAALLRNLGQLHLYQDRYNDARNAFDTSRRLFAALGHVSGEAVAALGTGSVHRTVGDLDAALETFVVALRGFRSAGDRHGETVAHNAVASVWLERGQAAAAAPWLESALTLARAVGDRHREAQVRRRVAVLHELQGEPLRSREELEHALGIFDELADTHCAAYVQQSIGELCLRQGNAGRASALLVEALAVQQQLGDRRAVARVAGLLGDLHHATGRRQTARRYYHRSLATWRRLDAGEQAQAVDAKLRALC